MFTVLNSPYTEPKNLSLPEAQLQGNTQLTQNPVTPKPKARYTCDPISLKPYARLQPRKPTTTLYPLHH